MTLPDRSDALMFRAIDRRERAGAAIEDAAARVWADPAQLARLLDDANCPVSLYSDVIVEVFPDAEYEGQVPTVAELTDALDAHRLDGDLDLPADVRDRLERYVRERVAARLGL